MGSCCAKSKENQTKSKLKSKSKFKPKSDGEPKFISNQTFTKPDNCSPSRIPTTDLTLIYELPSNKFKTEEEVVKSYGYLIEEQIAKGGYAIVFKAKKLSNNSIIACKIINLIKNRIKIKEGAKNELFIMQRISHPHIIRLYEHFMIKSPEKSSVYIFMQLADNNSISKFMRESEKPLSEPQSRKYFSQMVSAVRHMHKKGIAHRDLKMGNILLDKNNNILISDFGLSQVACRLSKGGTVLFNSYCGTVPYMAPEILINRTEKKLTYNPFVADIWALGVILYCILNKAYPFNEDQGFDAMISNQKKRLWKFSNHFMTDPPKELVDIFHRLLEPECDKRITIIQLADHPWIRNEIKSIPI